MEILIWVIVALLFVGGFIGTIVPGFPGLSLIFGGILLFAFHNDFAIISPVTVVLLGLLTGTTLLLDYVAGVVGAKAGGGGWRAALGAGVGALIGGIILNIPGIFLGAFVGGFLGAGLEGASHGKAVKVASYSALGVLGSTIFQLAIAVILVLSFFFAIFI